MPKPFFRIGLLGACAGMAVACGAARAQDAFWHFETPPVHPLAITPDGAKLLACNTADARIEVFDLTGTAPHRLGSIPVGVDPVSVRCRSNTEAWVVNTISDSVSIVNLATMNVVNTLSVGNEPMDVVFAGSPTRAFVSISQRNQVRVFDPVTLTEAAGSPIAIAGEGPRALATDGTRVYAALFESGSATAILPRTIVSNFLGPYFGQNPPPNAGANFNPPFNRALPQPPAVSLIVKKQGDNWVDDNNHIWNAFVPFDLVDNDVAIINAATLGVAYVRGLDLNIIANLAVQPTTGRITAVGMHHANHVRFEQHARSKFVKVFASTFDGSTGNPTAVVDLNPHLLPYSTTSIPQTQREQSIGDPRDVAWDSAGTRAYVSGMGSNNVIVSDATGARLATISVGQGPTGLALDEARDRLYCLNRFDGTISIINTTTDAEVLPRVSFFDPTPAVIKLGRPFQYDSHLTSGLGQASCNSCHVDLKTDGIAWDLGNPAGSMQPFDQGCNVGIPMSGICADWHPMKGPMMTQTMVGIVGNGPMHWRGDRNDLTKFTVGFTGLMGDDAPPTLAQMQQLTDYVATVHFPPQPNRTMTNGLPASVPGFSGNPANGQNLFLNGQIDQGSTRCVQCHALASGAANFVLSANLLLEPQQMKVAPLRSLHEKVGFAMTSQTNTRGFGFNHDGALDTIFAYLKQGTFEFPAGATGDAQRRDIEAFMMCWPHDTHPAVGVQTTVANGATVPPAQQTLINQMIALASAGEVGLIVKGKQAGLERGFAYQASSSNFQSDRLAQALTPTALLALAGAGSELTYTAVASGTQRRMGIDRDADGYFDRDELDACSDPLNAAVTPANLCAGDATHDGFVDVNDLLLVIGSWGAAGAPGFSTADQTCDGVVDVNDLLTVVGAWGPCP